jgi:GT2 family glycosyltransferase
MELSIIIVSYNVKEVLLQCIDSIYTYLKGAEFEIIVVDNNSSDGTIEGLNAKFPEITIIKNKVNSGFSEGNNQGIKISQGDYILLLNPDVYLQDDSLKAILAYIKMQDDNVIVSPKLLNPDNSVQTSAWKDKGLPAMLAELIRIFIDTYPLNEYTGPQAVDNVAGAAMLFKKTLVNKLGYLDSELFWMEDFDFCYRLRKSGGKVIYFPGASIVHYGGKSKDKNLGIAYANANISKLKFYKKHYSAGKTFFAELIILVHIVSRLLLFLCLAPFHTKFRYRLSAYSYTLKKYFRYVFLNDRALT